MLPHYSPPVNVHVHETYRSGQWTCRPGQVVLIVSGELVQLAKEAREYYW